MIEITNLTTISVDDDFLKKIAQKTLETQVVKEDYEISIVLVGQMIIRELNKRYRGRNRVTDVLSFGSNTKHKAQNTGYRFVEPPDGLLRIGEIVICLREAKKNAKEFGHSFQKELAILLIHGILHLLGYDDKTGIKKLKMMKRQGEILALLKIDLK